MFHTIFVIFPFWKVFFFSARSLIAITFVFGCIRLFFSGVYLSVHYSWINRPTIFLHCLYICVFLVSIHFVILYFLYTYISVRIVSRLLSITEFRGILNLSWFLIWTLWLLIDTVDRVCLHCTLVTTWFREMAALWSSIQALSTMICSPNALTKKMSKVMMGFQEKTSNWKYHLCIVCVAWIRYVILNRTTKDANRMETLSLIQKRVSGVRFTKL